MNVFEEVVRHVDDGGEWVVICTPEHEPWMSFFILLIGLDRRVEVQSSRLVPEGTIYVARKGSFGFEPDAPIEVKPHPYLGMWGIEQRVLLQIRNPADIRKITVT